MVHAHHGHQMTNSKVCWLGAAWAELRRVSKISVLTQMSRRLVDADLDTSCDAALYVRTDDLLKAAPDRAPWRPGRSTEDQRRRADQPLAVTSSQRTTGCRRTRRRSGAAATRRDRWIQHARDQLVDVRGRERVEREHARVRVVVQPRGANVAQFGTREAEQHDRRSDAPACDVLEHVEQRRLGPVQVLEDEDERTRAPALRRGGGAPRTPPRCARAAPRRRAARHAFRSPAKPGPAGTSARSRFIAPPPATRPARSRRGCARFRRRART